jgi:hypothetical protein
MKNNGGFKLNQAVVSVVSAALALLVAYSTGVAGGFGPAAQFSPNRPAPDRLLNPSSILELRAQAPAEVDESIDPSLMMPDVTGGPYTATLVMGQTNFKANFGSQPPVSLNSPAGVAIDRSVTPNRIYVADNINNRVLAWNNVSSLVNGQRADLVLGQPDFFSNYPNNGTLPGDINGVGPDSLFLGALESFVVANATGVAIPLRGNPPVANVAVDADGNVYVADTGNSRVLEYNRPFSNCASLPCVGPAASVVFGQGAGMGASGGSFYTNTGGTSATNLSLAAGVGLDRNGNLFVADSFNNRVLEYNQPLANPASPNVTANFVYGQGATGDNFTGNASGVGQTALADPTAVGFDSNNDLFVGDTVNNRVAEFDNPLSNFTINRVFGQDFNDDFDANSPGAGQNGLNAPVGVAFDYKGNLYVADAANARVLEFKVPFPSFPHTVINAAAV